MASVFEKQRRQLIITKALLLGYEFKLGVFNSKACYLLCPNGMYYAVRTTRQPPRGFVPLERAVAFPATWVAAN